MDLLASRPWFVVSSAKVVLAAQDIRVGIDDPVVA